MALIRWHDLAWTGFADHANAVAILPIGASEQHGPHLPVSTDTAINEGVVARAGAHFPGTVLLLPTQAVGVSVEHSRFPGSLYLAPETAIAVWSQIGACVARAGIRRILLFNSHGGQPQVAEIVCRRLRIEHRMLAATAMWSRITPMSDLVPADELRFGIHAGLVETSVMLALGAAGVVPSRARNFRNATEAWDQNRVLRAGSAVAFGWQAQDLNQAGAVGDAASATASLGEAILERAAASLVALVADLAAIDPDTWLKDDPDA